MPIRCIRSGMNEAREDCLNRRKNGPAFAPKPPEAVVSRSETHTFRAALIRNLILPVLCLFAGRAAAQTDSTANGFWSRIFLPSIEPGYQVPTSGLISPSLRFGTSIEYRFRNNNDFFVRLNYDTYGARYRRETNNATTNPIEGTVQFTDVTVSPGYRFGDNTFRFVVCACLIF